MIAALTISGDGYSVRVHLHQPGPKRRIEWSSTETIEALADLVDGGLVVTDESLSQLRVGKERGWSYRATWTAGDQLIDYVVQELSTRGFEIRIRQREIERLDGDAPEPIPFPSA